MNSAQSTSPPVSEKATHPAWRQHRLSELDSLFSQLRDVRVPDAESEALVHEFLWLTIAPIQDAIGQFDEPAPGVQASLSTRPDEHVFSFRNRVYRFPHGQYPAYDEMMRRWTAVIPPPGSPPGSPREWIAMDSHFIGQLEALKVMAESYVSVRQDAY